MSICSNQAFNDFFLAGGTSLSLQIGHRISIDLDFFTLNSFDPEELKVELQRLGKLEISNISKNTLQSFVGDIKVDFLTHRYPLIKPLKKEKNLRLASTYDIAAMKLNAIKNRGAKKDFYDIYYLLQKMQLKKIIDFFEEKYPEQNTFQVLKSLLYFEDAENQPDPVLIDHHIEWQEVKSKIKQEVSSVFTQ